MFYFAFLINSYRPPKVNKEDLKQAVVDFIEHQDYEKTFKELTSNDYVWSFLANKSKQQQATLKEHVRINVFKILAISVFFNLLFYLS